MALTQVTQTGEEHGLINTLGNSVKDDGMNRFAEKDRAKMQKMKTEDARIVKARYLHKDGKNEKLERPYCNWGGDPITMWRFLHDNVYEVPKGLVDDVNSPNKRQKKRAGFLVNGKGEPLETDQLEDPIHRFIPVEF